MDEVELMKTLVSYLVRFGDPMKKMIGQEFDNVIFSMDDNFRYSEDGHLQGKEHPNPDYKFYKLWYQGVSRAREKLCILVIGNQELFSSILAIKKNDATLMQK